MIRDAIVGSRLPNRAGLYETVLNAHFIMSALRGLSERGVALYFVGELRRSAELPWRSGQLGFYCVASLRRQHRLAAAMLQKDLVTCAVVDAGCPFRASLPLQVQECLPAVEQQVWASFVRAYAGLRLLVVHQSLARTLAAYYTYVVKCISGLLYHF